MKSRTQNKVSAATRLALPALLAVLPVASALAAGPSLETFVMATNGESNYGTYRQPDTVYNTFGSFGSYIPFNAHNDPSLLLGDNISGTYRQTDTTAATLADATSTNGSGHSGFGDWTYTGTASASASSGVLKSGSQAGHTGNADNATINSAESYGLMQEPLTVFSSLVPNGTTGMMHVGVQLDGSFSITGKGIAGMVLRYGYDGNPIANNSGRSLLESFVDIYGNGYQVYGPNGSYGNQTVPPGFTFTAGPLDSAGSPAYVTFGGTTTLYMDIPMSFGSSDTVEMGLMSFTGVDNGTGMMKSDFIDTARISSIQVFDSFGNEVKDFTVTSGSGTRYDANGVHPDAVSAPEPGTLALLVSGMVGLAGMPGITGSLRRRRQGALLGGQKNL